MRRGLLFPLCGLALPLLAAPPAYAPAARIASGEIRECSGLAASRRHPGIFWTHNDSGDTARLFAIRADGSLAATCAVEGAGAMDWEDIALDDQGFLYVADIGNNRRDRKDLRIYKIKEPDALADGTLPVAETIDVAYPDGNFNSEALCVDAAGELLIVTKDPKPTAIYRRAKEGWVRLQALDFPGLVTGADIGPDGRLALSTYFGIRILERAPGKPWRETRFILSELGKCEAICWDGPELVLANEGGEIHRLDPRRFAPGDAYLPERRTWDPGKDLEIIPVDPEGRPSRLRLSLKALADGSCRITAAIPEGVREGRLLFLFSREDVSAKLAFNDSDSAWLLEHAEGEVHCLQADPATGKPIPAAAAARASLRDGTLDCILPAGFLGSQKALAVCVQGFDDQPCGWPFGYWRVRDKPYLWARRAP